MNFPPFKMILVLTNFSLLSFLIMLMVDHYNSHYNVESWSSAFHVLTLLWLSIRGAFWFCTVISSTPWSPSTFYALYWMANPVEFGSFMLLPLFFSQVLYPSEWKKYWRYIRIAYIGVIGSLIVFQALWAFYIAIELHDGSFCDTVVPPKNGDTGHDCFHTEFSSDAFRAITASCFISLATVQAAYGFKLAFLDKKSHERYLISSPSILAGVNIILVISFLSRGLYQFGTIFRIFLLSDIPLQGSDDVSFTILFVFIVWDYIPTTLLVITITSKSLGTSTSRVKSKLKNATWSTYKETSSIYTSRITFPGYGLFQQLADEEGSSVASSYPSQASSADVRGGTHGTDHWFNNEIPQADPSLKRFEQPSSLTPPTSWLNNSFLQVGGRRTSFRSHSHSHTPSHSQSRTHGTGPHTESSSSLDAIPTGFLSNGQPQSSFLFGSYRSYSQGSEKENERELAILLYYDNDRKRRSELSAAALVQSPESAARAGLNVPSSSSGSEMRDPERGAGSYSERGAVAGTGTGSYTAGSGSAWQYRSIPYEGEDRDKTTARREMEARASSSTMATAHSNNDNYNSFNMYGRDTDIMRGSDSKASSSSSRGDRDRDRDSAVQNKQSLKIDEERTLLPRGSSFREEKAMVTGAYDAAARGAEAGGGMTPRPYESDGSAASKEVFGQGTGTGTRKSSSTQAPPGFQIPLEQKVCASSSAGSGSLRGSASDSLVALYESYQGEQRQQKQQGLEELEQQQQLLQQQQQQQLYQQQLLQGALTERRSISDATSARTRNYISRSSSASRAQQRPLQRREASHALPMVNTPSPPDFAQLAQGIVAAADQGQRVALTPAIAPMQAMPKVEELQIQPPTSSVRKGSNGPPTNIYSPGAQYSPLKKAEEPPRAKQGTYCRGKGKFVLRDYSTIQQIPQFRPRGEVKSSREGDTAPAREQLINLDPSEAERQRQRQGSMSQQVLLPTPSLNIFGAINPFKNFDPFGISQGQGQRQGAEKSPIPPTITNSPNAAKSPKIELIHSRPTRPIAGSGSGVFFIPGGGSGFGTTSFGPPYASKADSSMAGQTLSLRSEGSTSSSQLATLADGSCGQSIGTPKSEDDLTFMSRDEITIARPPTVPYNPTSPCATTPPRGKTRR